MSQASSEAVQPRPEAQTHPTASQQPEPGGQAEPKTAPPLPIGFSQPETGSQPQSAPPQAPWNPPLAPGETAASTSGQLPVVPPPTAKPVTDLDEPFAVPSAQQGQNNPDDTDTPPRGLRLPVNDRGWFDELPDSASAASSSEPPQTDETTFGPSGDPTEIPYRYRK